MFIARLELPVRMADVHPAQLLSQFLHKRVGFLFYNTARDGELSEIVMCKLGLPGCAGVFASQASGSGRRLQCGPCRSRGIRLRAAAARGAAPGVAAPLPALRRRRVRVWCRRALCRPFFSHVAPHAICPTLLTGSNTAAAPAHPPCAARFPHEGCVFIPLLPAPVFLRPTNEWPAD